MSNTKVFLLTKKNVVFQLRCPLFTLDTAKTAAERICPWRRLSATDEQESSKNPPGDTVVSTKGNQSRLHHSPLTAANFSGACHKPSAYMGHYATTTKPEEESSRPHLRDVFNKSSKDTDTDSNRSVSRL